MFSEKFLIEELFLKFRAFMLYIIFWHHTLYRTNLLKLFFLVILSVLMLLLCGNI